MTNEEWLKSLPTESFAEVVVHLSEYVPGRYIYGYTSQVYGFSIWLAMEREENALSPVINPYAGHEKNHG